MYVGAIAIVFVIGQLMVWGQGIADVGGAEIYVRGKTDLVATLTGALMIRDGDGASLYNLELQHRYQERVLAPSVALHPDTTLPYLHPPFESLLFAPLMHLSYSFIFGI